MAHPVITYGAETWVFKSTDERFLKVFERKSICKIYGMEYKTGEQDSI